MVPKSFQRYIERKHNTASFFLPCLHDTFFFKLPNCVFFSLIFSIKPKKKQVYGKGKEDSNEWDNTFGDMLDSSLEGEIKSEPYDTMYDDDENYSENSNLD